MFCKLKVGYFALRSLDIYTVSKCIFEKWLAVQRLDVTIWSKDGQTKSFHWIPLVKLLALRWQGAAKLRRAGDILPKDCSFLFILTKENHFKGELPASPCLEMQKWCFCKTGRFINRILTSSCCPWRFHSLWFLTFLMSFLIIINVYSMYKTNHITPKCLNQKQTFSGRYLATVYLLFFLCAWTWWKIYVIHSLPERSLICIKNVFVISIV